MGQKSKANAPAKGKPPPPNKAQTGDVKKEPPVEPAGPTVDDLFVALDQHVRADDYKKIVKVADQILAKEPDCVEAKQCKVVALIQDASNDNEIPQALQVIEASKTPALDLSFEKAYCLYRRSKPSEALAALKGLERNANVLQLEAQILWRKEELKECITSYERLFKQHKVTNDVKTNIVAAYVAGGRAAEVPSLMETLKVQPRTGFELAYNAACALIDKEDYTKAEELLQLAHRIGQEALIEEDVPEEDIESELAFISVQLAYVRQMQHRFDEALELYNTILKKKPADPPSLAVATNNLIALKGARDLFDALKKTEKLLEKRDAGTQKLQFAENLEYKLSMRQKEALSFNRCLLLLHSNKLDQARDFVSLLSKSFPESAVPPVLSSSLLWKEGKAQKADELLAEFAESHPEAGANVHFIRAQAVAAAGNYLQAAKYLELIPSLRHKPAMTATLVALKLRGGNVNGAESVLDEAVEYWDSYMGDEDQSSTLESILQEAAAFKLKHNKMDSAAKLYERLMKSASPVVRTQALHGLVSSYAYTNPDKAAEYEKKLPALRGLASLDVEALEKVPPWSLNVKRGRAVEETGEKIGEDRSGDTKTKKKRKRKPLYPKGFDAANPGPPPDPERWLPRKERSSYRPKKGKRNQAPIRGSQGSVSKEKSSDLSAGASIADSGNKSVGGGKTITPTEIPKPTPPAHRGKKKGRH